MRLLEYVDRIPSREYKRFRHTIQTMNKVSTQLIQDKTENLLTGDKSNKDIMSVLGKLYILLRVACFELTNGCTSVRANVSENPQSKLSDEEMMAQMWKMCCRACVSF